MVLPQDVYKSVSQPRAFQCLVRLRTAPELQVRGAHGRLLPDRCVWGGLGSEGLFLALPGWLVVSAPSCASVQQGLLHIICTILYATLFCSEHANLWSLVACGPDDALSFSLDRSSARASCTAPVVQLVIQYSQLVPVAPAAGGGGAAAAPGTR